MLCKWAAPGNEETFTSVTRIILQNDEVFDNGRRKMLIRFNEDSKMIDIKIFIIEFKRTVDAQGFTGAMKSKNI